MKSPVYKKLDAFEADLDDLDKFEFEEQDDLREFFEDSNTENFLL